MKRLFLLTIAFVFLLSGMAYALPIDDLRLDMLEMLKIKDTYSKIDWAMGQIQEKKEEIKRAKEAAKTEFISSMALTTAEFRGFEWQGAMFTLGQTSVGGLVVGSGEEEIGGYRSLGVAVFYPEDGLDSDMKLSMVLEGVGSYHMSSAYEIDPEYESYYYTDLKLMRELTAGSYNVTFEASSPNMASILLLSDSVTIAPAPIPEPATILLIGTGLVGFAIPRIRKKLKM